jgi:N6-L-threonylcarbamoyladenine synthase
MKKSPIILAIDTSCDDTSVALTRGNKVISNLIASQTQVHQKYGGVFPTVAKEEHKKNLPILVDLILQKNHLAWEDLEIVAITYGPGLAPALEVSLNFVKNLKKKYSHLKFLSINHLQAHLLSVLITNNNDKSKEILKNLNKNLPALGIIVSGGHSSFVKIKSPLNFELLGETLDDACGECLDKVGRMLSLGYPAGHIIEELAKDGDEKAFKFPLPLTTQKNYNLSFSGLKTFSKNLINKLTKEEKMDRQTTLNFCASFQYACFRHLNYKLKKLLEKEDFNSVWLGGGVSSNIYLRKTIRDSLKSINKKNNSQMKLMVPFQKKFCTDNAVMIGVAGYFLWKMGKFVNLEKIERKPNLSVNRQ